MPEKYRFLPAVLVPLMIFAVILVYTGASAQPGTETDPVVSLSYLETALSYTPISLEGGEDFRFNGNGGVMLINGNSRMSLPTDTSGGRFYIVDITEGVVHETDVDMVAGHMYVPVSDEPASAIFTVQAWQRSTIAVPGGTGS